MVGRPAGTGVGDSKSCESRVCRSQLPTARSRGHGQRALHSGRRSLPATTDPDPLQQHDIYCRDPVDCEFDQATSISQGVGYFLASVGDCDVTLAPPSG